MSRPTDVEPRMWSYWRDKYSIKTALEDYYPESARNDPQLSLALAQLKNAELVIDTIMTERGEEDERKQT
jgi:hypothetical protein